MKDTKCIDVWTRKRTSHSHILDLSSFPANNLEVFFMFPQAKNRQEGKARSLTPQADALFN